MGYRTVRANDLDSLYRRKEGTQYFLFITNIVMLLVGLANFCVCIWIRSAGVLKIKVVRKHYFDHVMIFVRFDLDFWEWVEEINWYTYWNAM